MDFVKGLSEVSWEEIQSSSSAAQPRLFSLQKLVDIAYYNMDRIRLEWSGIWAILGVHFNQASPEYLRLVICLADVRLFPTCRFRFAVTTTPTLVSLAWTL